jgi:hypothetical protein
VPRLLTLTLTWPRERELDPACHFRACLWWRGVRSQGRWRRGIRRYGDALSDTGLPDDNGQVTTSSPTEDLFS